MPILNKHVVITSIFAPTHAVRSFAAQADTRVIVAGDKKSPPEYDCPGVRFIDWHEQGRMGSKLASLLPYNHYCRKMLGYLAAVAEGAQYILDTDDDNIPKVDIALPSFDTTAPAVPGNRGFVNIYELYTDKKIWPRGLPLRLINTKTIERDAVSGTVGDVGIWQGLADGDPDVDAIYRLTNGALVDFDSFGPVALEAGTICPFNSQNTLFRNELFALLYLPGTVTFRYTDILRGLIAQPIMWAAGYRLGFFDATVVQERNAHDFTRDFESEVPMYLTLEKVIPLCQSVISAERSIGDNLAACYSKLAQAGIVQAAELPMVEAWLHDLKMAQA
jgi:hypothetical protein